MNYQQTAVCEAADNGWRPHSDCCGFGADGTPCACYCHGNDVVCKHGVAMDVHCCNCHSGFIFDMNHECPEARDDA